MIDRRELRTGNWVGTVYNTPYIKITEIKNHVVCGVNCKGVSYPSLKPIPLTEEILLKCGFERTEYNDYRHPVLIGTLTLFDRVCEIHFGDLYSLWIESLHQLQNLYFDLLGEELEVHL